jgi:trans-aconitate methyltransferase
MTQHNWNPALYDQKHAFVFEYGQELLTLLNPQPGEQILDLGCGTGHLTAQIAASGATVTGMDSSPAMIATAQQNYPHLKFILSDATDFALTEQFDAVFSNAVLHWVTRAEAATVCIARALKPGGRFVAEFGGKGNTDRVINAVVTAVRELTQTEVKHGWYYPSLGEYAVLLEKHDLAVREARLFDRPTALEGADGLRNWLKMFGEKMLQNLDEDTRQKVFRLAEDKLRDTQFVDGKWFVDYRRLRVVADKTAG